MTYHDSDIPKVDEVCKLQPYSIDIIMVGS